MTEEEIKECEKTFPVYTVYVCRKNGKIIRAETFHKYANWGKTYKECSEKVKSKDEYEEIQDKNLYEVALLLEKEKQETKFDTDYLEKLRNISSDIDELLNDMDEEYGEW